MDANIPAEGQTMTGVHFASGNALTFVGDGGWRDLGSAVLRQASASGLVMP